jgi:hypothetical protein
VPEPGSDTKSVWVRVGAFASKCLAVADQTISMGLRPEE